MPKKKKTETALGWFQSHVLEKRINEERREEVIDIKPDQQSYAQQRLLARQQQLAQELAQPQLTQLIEQPLPMIYGNQFVRSNEPLTRTYTGGSDYSIGSGYGIASSGNLTWSAGIDVEPYKYTSKDSIRLVSGSKETALRMAKELKLECFELIEDMANETWVLISPCNETVISRMNRRNYGWNYHKEYNHDNCYTCNLIELKTAENRRVIDVNSISQ
jgi:hypothetical protein